MWHFTNAEGKLRYDDGRQVIVGETLTVTCDPALCESGLHASPRIIDALKYAPGLRLWEVQLDGAVVEDHDKSVATRRTALRDYGDCTAIVVRFAKWCTRRAKKCAAAHCAAAHYADAKADAYAAANYAAAAHYAAATDAATTAHYATATAYAAAHCAAATNAAAHYAAAKADAMGAELKDQERFLRLALAMTKGAQ